MRYLVRFLLLLLALGTLRVVGCGDETGQWEPECQTNQDCDDQNECTADFCEGSCWNEAMYCDDGNDCTHDECDPDTGCDNPAKPNGTYCGGCVGWEPCPGLELFSCCMGYGGNCKDAECCPDGICPEPPPPNCDDVDDCTEDTCPCTECGIRNAVAAGGGPYTFNCEGPTRVVTQAEIVIGNDVILDGEGNLTVDANDAHRVFSVWPPDVTAELRGVTVTGGLTYDGGGGIYNYGVLTLTNTTVSGNAAEFWPYTSYGGGIYNHGVLTLTNSTVSGNTSYGSGGGIQSWSVVTLTNSTVSGNTAYHGGGLWSDGTLTLTNTTVSGNTAEALGGGIESQSGTLTLTNSTVSGNRGGGISASGTLTLTNSTVSGNTAGLFGGAINTAGGEGTLTNSLVDGDCQGYYNVSGGYNIESPGDTCGFDQTTDLYEVPDLKLGPLQDNGGLTETHALLPGSPAINRIPGAACEVETDQRGEPRPETGGTMCDVGSFEVQPAP